MVELGDQATTAVGMESGHFPVAVDDKGRLAIPSELRGGESGPHGDRLIVTKFRVEARACLDAFFPQDWQVHILDKLAKKNRFNRSVMRFQRAYVHAARECALDGQGRIVIPAELRQYAGIKREAFVTRDAHKIQIWERDSWNQLNAEDLGIFDDTEVLEALDL